MDAMLRALGEPHRRQILALVRDRELPAGQIADHFPITRPAVSQHLSVLKEAGLVAERRAGTRRLYRATPESLTALRVMLEDFWGSRLAELTPSSAGERISVERELVIAATRQRVWSLLVDPEAATRWMGRAASFDLRVGGHYRVEVLPGLVASGEFLEIEPPSRLVHTWGWELPSGGPVQPGSTVVLIELRETDGGTRLRLCHRELPSIDTAASHSRGWTHYLARLAAVASERAPGPDPWVTDPARMRDELRPASGAPPPRDDRGEIEMTTQKTIEDYFRALSKREDWPAFFADDVTFTSHANPRKQVNGREAFVESTKGFYSMIRGVDVLDLIVDGDRACATTRYSLQPPGREAFHCDVAELYAVKGGLIDSFEIYFDSAAFA